MRGFKSIEQAQRFLAVHNSSPSWLRFRPSRLLRPVLSEGHCTRDRVYRHQQTKNRERQPLVLEAIITPSTSGANPIAI